MNNDLISRSALITAIQDHFDNLDVYFPSAFIKEVEEAPTVTPTFGLFKEMLCSECEKRPKGELSEKLNKRIEESICKSCQMNKRFKKPPCEICEISRVFQIITLTMEEQKGGVENGN